MNGPLLTHSTAVGIWSFSGFALLLLIDLEGQIEKSTIIAGNFDTSAAPDKNKADKKKNQ